MWHQIQLSSSDISAKREFILQDEFVELWTAAGSPRNVAMFAGKQDDNGVTIYLKDSSAKLASAFVAKYGGEQCPKPISKDLSLLVGHGLNVREIQ